MYDINYVRKDNCKRVRQKVVVPTNFFYRVKCLFALDIHTKEGNLLIKRERERFVGKQEERNEDRETMHVTEQRQGNMQKVKEKKDPMEKGEQ